MRSFSAFAIFGNFVSQKVSIVEQNGMIFGTQQYSAALRAQNEIWGFSNTYMYMVYLWSCRVQGNFRVIRCTCVKIAHDLKTAVCDRRAKRSEIWDSRTLKTPHVWSTFDLAVFNVIWASFGTFVSETAGLKPKYNVYINASGQMGGNRGTSTDAPVTNPAHDTQRGPRCYYSYECGRVKSNYRHWAGGKVSQLLKIRT